MILSRFETPNEFLCCFNPKAQNSFCKHEKKCYIGEAPTLFQLSLAYDERVPEIWLEAQIKDLSEFAGCKDKLDTEQIEQIAQTLYANHKALKVTEYMIFFQLFKSGYFGHFYGAVDALVITSSFLKFKSIRNEKKAQYEKEELARIKLMEEIEHAKRVVTREEYEETKWLLNMGYEPERIKRELQEQRLDNSKKQIGIRNNDKKD